MARKALIAGSFDPVTNGHLDLIKRTSHLFDEVYVAIGQNPDKKYMFTIDERKSFVENVLSEYTNVVVVSFTGLLSEFAFSLNVDCIVRGIRNSSDYTSENTLAFVNKNIKGVETLFMPCSAEFASVSSSVVKAIVKEKGFVHDYVPLEVKAALEERILGRRYFGITGGSGSGKSYIAKELQDKNNFNLCKYPDIDEGAVLHVDLDKFAHEIYDGNKPYEMACKETMGLYFGREIFNDDMTINRKQLAERVFSNPRDLAVLNEIMKKPMRHKFYEAVKNTDANIILVDGAILIETGLIELLNNNCILVSCDEDTAIERIMTRDSISLGYARKRIQSQIKSDIRAKLLDDAIEKNNYGCKVDVDTTDGCSIDALYADIVKMT